MSENTTAEDLVKELQEPEKFDIADFVKEAQTTFPTREVVVYTDGEAALRSLELADEAADLKAKKEALESESSGTIVGADTSEVDAKLEAKEEEIQALIERLKASALTFTLRGVPPKVWRTIDKVWRNKIVNKKNDDEQTLHEKNITRNEHVSIDVTRNGIQSIRKANGAVSEGIPSYETVEWFYDNLLESEWEKLKTGVEELTFAHNLFVAASADADFLPKPSDGQETDGTSVPSE